MEKYILDTIDYYDKECLAYSDEWSNNFTSNFNFNIPDIFISYLDKDAYILDLGCGHGRDTIYFLNKGYRVKAVDGSREMCKLASQNVGINVEQINFLDIDYDNLFDGVFASASLLHLNNKDLIVVLKKISKALKTDGILVASFKYGDNERLKEERYFNDMNEIKFSKLCENVSDFSLEKSITNDGFKNHKSFITFVLKKVR